MRRRALLVRVSRRMCLKARAWSCRVGGGSIEGDESKDLEKPRKIWTEWHKTVLRGYIHRKVFARCLSVNERSRQIVRQGSLEA